MSTVTRREGVVVLVLWKKLEGEKAEKVEVLVKVIYFLSMYHRS